MKTQDSDVDMDAQGEDLTEVLNRFNPENQTRNQCQNIFRDTLNSHNHPQNNPQNPFQIQNDNSEPFKTPHLAIISDDHSYKIYYKVIGNPEEKNKMVFEQNILQSILVFLKKSLVNQQSFPDFTFCLLSSLACEPKVHEALFSGLLGNLRTQFFKLFLENISHDDENSNKMFEVLILFYSAFKKFGPALKFGHFWKFSE